MMVGVIWQPKPEIILASPQQNMEEGRRRTNQIIKAAEAKVLRVSVIGCKICSFETSQS